MQQIKLWFFSTYLLEKMEIFKSNTHQAAELMKLPA